MNRSGIVYETGRESMRITVRLAGPLARAAGREEIEADVGGGDIHGLISHLCDTYPGLGAELCGTTGELKPYLVIFHRGVLARSLAGAGATLSGGDEIDILLPLAGG
ncbi:hypothetical protein AMJ82_01690 [candidate division TA06 bacterium SM23_40]|uniref:MoaD/ThiS family protein n=2 Tax=Bacteria division TA06 TaxID=1156500 RepID=A0A0S8GDN9_UNCT6|nr:MAG: hypothetical protein AMJ82_01690 [candidate division TA06 bacterium SM23_40]